MKTDRKLIFIYNPHSGKARIRSNLLDIIDIFVKAGYEVCAYPTQSSGDATKAVGDMDGDFKLVACSGGDGTLNEVVYGMMGRNEKVPILYIPAGSTNDFARSLHIPSRMKQAASLINNGTLSPMDVGALNDRYYIYVAAFGVFTEVTYTTPQTSKNALGHSAYILEALKTLPYIRSYHIKVKWEEGVIEDDFLYGMITNSTSVGGFAGITGHHVDMFDGYHEVTLIRNPENPVELGDTIRAMLDRSLDSDNIITFKSRHIIFESKTQIKWTLDGEYGGEYNKAEINVLQGAVNIMVP